MRIAVNGAGIAGPTLAYWLRRGGHDVTLIEEAETLRTGGYIIDFWGLGYTIAERMGVQPWSRMTSLLSRASRPSASDQVMW